MPTVSETFASMEYGPAPETDKIAQAWLNDHGKKFGHFINNKWVLPEGRNFYDTKAPATGQVLASTVQGTPADVDQAVSAAKAAYSTWSQLSGHVRARHLYSLARTVQKHSRLIAVIEALDNGKSIRETRDADVLIVVRHLYYYAGWAELMEEQLGSRWKSVGVVGAIVPWNFPLMLLTWKVAPALAAGNTVVLKPATYTRLSALFFAELCAEAGLPEGVFNVITGGGAMGQNLAEHPHVDKVAFTGSTEIGKILRQATAGSGKKLSLELGGKSPVIVYENADLDSAVESVVDAIWFNQGHVCSAGSKLLVQEPVFEKFVEKLKKRLSHFRIGRSLDKTIDMGAINSEDQLKTIIEFVKSAEEEGADIFQISSPEGCFYPPTLITGVNTASRVVVEEIFGPVLVALPFRTAKEAISIANNTIYGLAASVHTEQLTLALETAKHIKAGTVWINCHNIFDAASGFGGFKQSGFGRDGGYEGFLEYLKPIWQTEPLDTSEIKVDLKKFGTAYVADGPTVNVEASDPKSPLVNHTYKLYYGGGQKRPDGQYCRSIKNSSGQEVGLVGQSNRKDIRNAVEAAQKAQPGWAKRSGFNRAQILYYIAENLELRKSEFAQRISSLLSKPLEESEKEVLKAIQRLFHWAAIADKFGGEVQETQLYGTVIRLNEPVGVIGIVCPTKDNNTPLLTFVSLMAAAISRGNSVVVIPHETCPLPALDMYQIFDTSDLPGGVVNILTGDHDHMAKYLAEHQDLESVWYFGSREGSRYVEHASADSVKRTWVNYGLARDWMSDAQGEGEEFLYHSVEFKNVHLTMGDIFAN